MTFGEILEVSKMPMLQLAKYLNIPYRTVQDWKYGSRKCPDYVLELIEYKLRHENII